VAPKDKERNKIVQEVEERRQIGRSSGKIDGRTVEDEKTGMTGQSKIKREISTERKKSPRGGT
jgi:hypothetical protein